MTDSGKVTLEEALRATPLNDGPGRWYDVFSPTRVLIAEVKLDHNMNQQQQQVNKDTILVEKKKTKKCRGNRKEQRRRRKLRRQEAKKTKKQNHEEPMNGMDHDRTVSNDGQRDVDEETVEEEQHERVQVSCRLCRNGVVIIDD